MVKPLNPNPKIGNKGLTYYQRKYDRPKFQIDTPPLVNTTLPNPKILSATAAPASRNLILRSAKPGDPEPYVYGYTAVRPMVIAADDSADTLVLDLLWSAGEISQIEGPYLYIPDVGSVDVAGGTSPLLHEHFLGTAGQSASTIMTALKGSYDTLAGKAHSVVSMQVGWNLNLMGFIYGRLVFDPRNSPNVRTYSANPALILADVLTLCGYTCDDTATAAAANYCDELTGTDSPQDKRWEIGLVINTRESLQYWVHSLAAYASCYVDVQGSNVALVPDKPRASSFTYTAADMLEGTCRVRKRGARNAPDAVRVIFKSFIDRTFETVYPGATSPETTFAPGTISTLNMPGWNDFARAKRKAEEVYRKAQSDTEVEFVTFDKGLLPALGDVCTITNAAYGLSSATFVLTESEELERGRWRLSFQEYSASNYSDAQYSGSSNTTQLFNPYYPPPGSTPTLTAELVTATSPNYYRIKIDFAPQTWAYLQDYKVNTYIDGVPGTILHSEYPAKGSETGSPETITVYADLTDSPGFQMSIGNSPQTVYRVDVYNRSLWTNQDGTEVLSSTPGTATITDPVILDLTDGLQAWWAFDEASGDRLNSHPVASPNLYTFSPLVGVWPSSPSTAGGSVGSTTGLISNAVQIDTSSPANWLTTRFGGSDGIATAESFSIAGWVKFDTMTGPQFLFRKGNTEAFPVVNSQDWELYMTSSKIIWQAYGVSGISAVTHADTLSSGTWYFVCATFDQSGVTSAVSVNAGAPSSDTTPPVSPIDPLQKLHTALHAGVYCNPAYGWHYPLNGALDEWGFWNRVLTSDEITWLYNSGSGRAYTDL